MPGSASKPESTDARSNIRLEPETGNDLALAGNKNAAQSLSDLRGNVAVPILDVSGLRPSPE